MDESSQMSTATKQVERESELQLQHPEANGIPPMQFVDHPKPPPMANISENSPQADETDGSKRKYTSLDDQVQKKVKLNTFENHPFSVENCLLRPDQISHNTQHLQCSPPPATFSEAQDTNYMPPMQPKLHSFHGYPQDQTEGHPINRYYEDNLQQSMHHDQGHMKATPMAPNLPAMVPSDELRPSSEQNYEDAATARANYDKYRLQNNQSPSEQKPSTEIMPPQFQPNVQDPQPVTEPPHLFGHNLPSTSSNSQAGAYYHDSPNTDTKEGIIQNHPLSQPPSSSICSYPEIKNAEDIKTEAYDRPQFDANCADATTPEKQDFNPSQTEEGNSNSKDEHEHKESMEATQKSDDSYEAVNIHEKLKEMGEISVIPRQEGLVKSKKDDENEVSLEIKQKNADKYDTEDSKRITNLRKNIREVMDENQLDATTITAQRQESERLARVQEQQKIIRELQRQTATERLNNRTQNRVISLLQGQTSLSKSSSSGSAATSDRNALAGSSSDMYIVKGVASEVTFKDSGFVDVDKVTSGNLTPSVSIAPVRRSKIADSDLQKDTFDKKEVVTIVDSSSDDDCIVLSDDEDDLYTEPEDDPHNSGLHVNDVYNVPDDQGRVVINIGHPEGEPDVFLAPQVARIIKPHQIGGVRFLFDNIIESLERFNTSTGFGCILAHSMGLGKTLQLVCFCDIFLRHTSSRSILCIMPINTLQNWVSEFNMWLPEDPESSPLREQGEVRPRNFKLFVLNDQFKTLSARSKVILEWARQGGVLLIGYELYRLLSLKLAAKKKKGKKGSVEKEKIETEAHKQLMEDIHAALVKPGPDLVICDEGHRIKNSHASISLALKQIRSKRRIVLTGYPLQNNLLEYWCMVDFVRPNYLGTKTEFANMFERPIQNGQCIDSTPQDIKLMRYRAHVLHSLLVGFVQRRSHVVLQNSLPQKEEYVILVRMTTFQRKLYDVFMNEVVRTKAVPNPLKAFAVCCKIWNHPDVLYNFLKKREADLDLELEEVESETTGTNATAVKVKKKPTIKKGKEAIKDETSFPSVEVSPSESNTPTESLKEVPKEEKTESSSEANSNQEAAEKYSQQHPYQLPQQTQPKDETMPNLAIPQQEQQSLDYPSEYDSNYHLFNSYGCDNYFGNFNNVFQQSQYTNQNYDSNFNPPNSYWQGEMSNYYGYNNPTQITSDQYQNNQSYANTDNKGQETVDGSSSNSDKQSEIVDLDTKEIKTVETTIDPNDIIIPPNPKVSKEPKPETTETKPEVVEEISIEKVQAKAKEDGIPYDWALELMKGYVPNLLEISPKMVIFFRLLEESLILGDRVLVFSQSLLTLNLIEQFLQKNKVPGCDYCWAKNSTYFRLDGSTTAMEREKLINEFNSNPQIHLFLVSTRAGSLGINLVGANRVIVFDASWNPCHDTQAVCRVYRYGQRKPCFVYRLVMDNCLEKKIYDRQVNKQGMSDRVVDECNPDAHLSLKEVTNLCYDEEKDDDTKDLSTCKDKYVDTVIQKVIEIHHNLLSKEPFHHESLLVDRKEKKLSQAEKRLAQRGYEMEKRAAAKPAYIYNSTGTQYRVMKTPDGGVVHRPVASVRPMQAEVGDKLAYPGRPGGIRPTRWIPAEVWQRQGMTAQEMTLPLDVVIPTSSGDKSNIVLKAGQKVMVLKSPKGIYMQLESGKIIAIRTSLKVGQNREKTEGNDTGISKNILEPDETFKRGSTPEEKKEKSIFLPSNDTSASSGKFLKKEYGMESSTNAPKNMNNFGQHNKSENLDNKVKECYKTNMKPQSYPTSQTLTPSKQSIGKNFLNNKYMEEGNSSAANAFKKSDDVIMVGAKHQPRNVQSSKQNLCMKTTPMRNFGYNVPMSRQQVGHGSPGSYMSNPKPNINDSKVWTPEKNQSPMQNKAIPPTITIDDDFDPPVREKLVYKPNLVERKSKSSNRPAATYLNNQIKKPENRQSMKPPTNHNLPSSTNAKPTEQSCTTTADKTRQTQNVKPYNKFCFDQGQKMSTPDLPTMQSADIPDNKSNSRQVKMPTIRNIPAPYPSVSTAMVQNVPTPIHASYQQSNISHHPEPPLTEQEKLTKPPETSTSEPSYTALSQHQDSRLSKRDEVAPYPSATQSKDERNRKSTSNDLGSQNFQNLPTLSSTNSAPKETAERTENEYPPKYAQHVPTGHGQYMAPPNGPSYLYNRPDLDAYQKCFPGVYNSQPGAAYNYPPHATPSQPTFSYGSFPSHPYNPYANQQSNPPVSQPSQYHYSGFSGSEPRPPTSEQYNPYYNYSYPQQSDQWQ